MYVNVRNGHNDESERESSFGIHYMTRQEFVYGKCPGRGHEAYSRSREKLSPPWKFSITHRSRANTSAAHWRARGVVAETAANTRPVIGRESWTSANPRELAVIGLVSIAYTLSMFKIVNKKRKFYAFFLPPYLFPSFWVWPMNSIN